MPGTTTGGLPTMLDSDPLADVALSIRNMADALDPAAAATDAAATLSGSLSGTQRAYRRGTVGIFTFVLSASGALAAGATLATLPAGYRPVAAIKASVFHSTGTACLLSIATTGVVTCNLAMAVGNSVQGTASFPL